MNLKQELNLQLFADAGTVLEPNHVYYNPTWEMPKEEMK